MPEPTYAVMIVEHSHVPDENASWWIEGFPTRELAAEFARRWTRDSLEEHRGPGKTRDEVLKGWLCWGENALVVGSPPVYNARDEIEFFLDHPATAEGRDWKAVKRLAGLEKPRAGAETPESPPADPPAG